MHFSLRSKLVAFFLASSLLAVAAISVYLLTFYGTDKRSSLRRIENTAFRQRVENLESMILSAQAGATARGLDAAVSSNVILVADGACDPHAPPTFSIPRQNRAHLELLGLSPTMWTNGLDFFLACKRVSDARAAAHPVPPIQLLPSKVELAVPYLAVLFADATSARLVLISMDQALDPSGARVFLAAAPLASASADAGAAEAAGAAANASMAIVWSADPRPDLDAAMTEAGLAPDRLRSTLASAAPSGRIDLGLDTQLSFGWVLDHWRLVSLAHLPLISESVAFAIRQIVFLAVGMLSLNALVGLRFANLIARPLEELRKSTEKIGAGQFDFRFEIHGKNEIEGVKRSFNSMTERIAALIEDNRKKAEVDSELKLAREVGSMLFPKDSIELPGLELSARMNRSEQFSGEWWGYSDLSDSPGGEGKRVVLIADLQKSGTLGALAIAALRGSAAAVEAWARAKPELAADPCAVLKTLMDALAAAGRGTFEPALFAAVIDHRARQLRCARAGATGGAWIGPGGSQVQSVSAGADAYQSFVWEPGAKLLAYTPRLTALQAGGTMFSTEALDRAIATGASLGASGLLSKVAQARASMVKAANYTMIACSCHEILDETAATQAAEATVPGSAPA